MNKRIKLTDEELAIGMWVYIYLKISEYEKDSGSYVVGWKTEYLRAHGKAHAWRNNCLLCSRYYSIFSTCNCPLSEDGKNCGEGSTYESVHLYYMTKSHKAQALKACKRIIGIMIKEADKDEVENGEERE